jgi:hypothetical protein
LSEKQVNSIVFRELNLDQSKSWKVYYYASKVKLTENFINNESILAKFLNKNKHNNTPDLFYSTIIEILNETGALNDSKNKQTLESYFQKLITAYSELKKIYTNANHMPLSERYEKAIEYLRKRQVQLRNEFISSSNGENKTNKMTNGDESRNEISLFNPNRPSFVKGLNAKLNVKELFNDILPKIDNLSDFKSTYTNVYDLDLQSCETHTFDEKLEKWKSTYNDLIDRVPHHKKLLLVNIECGCQFMNSKPAKPLDGNLVIFSKETYHAWIVKKGSWLKDKTTDQHVELKFENINEAQRQLKSLSKKYDLNRWYFFYQQANGRVHQGYLDSSLQRFSQLIVILKEVEEFDDAKKDQILEILLNELKIDKSNDHQKNSICSNDSDKFKFIRSMNEMDAKNHPIKIYNLDHAYESIELKNRIRDNRQKSFGCVAKFAQNSYIALLIEKSPFNVVINIINSRTDNQEEIRNKLSWMEGFFDGCTYKIEHVKCPLESPVANNNLLHAFVNACASNWSLDCNYWSFLKSNFYRQEFSTRQNIELLKMLAIKNDVILVENEESSPKKSQILIDFEEKFTVFYQFYLSSFSNLDNFESLIENQIQKIDQIETFGNLEEFINTISSADKEPSNGKDDLLKQVDLIARNEGQSMITIDQIKIFLIKQVKLKSIESLEFKERVLKLLEHFESSLHETLLYSILDRNQNNQQAAHVIIFNMIENSAISFSSLKTFLENLKQIKPPSSGN